VETTPNVDFGRGGLVDQWADLPWTREESRAVADLHERAFGQGGRRLLAQGEQPDEGLLKRELPGYSISHLATHGFFNPEGVSSRWLEARDEAQAGASRPAGQQESVAGQNPGLLTGLVCAGANSGGDGQEDGYLTAEEVGWLDLSAVRLVVLSACETGLGQARSGGGLIGLRRAFRQAGAETVVCSLWNVPDESTATLMKRFYENLLLGGQGRLEALRNAQLEMLQTNRSSQDHPITCVVGRVRALRRLEVGPIRALAETPGRGRHLHTGECTPGRRTHAL
jgi:CHAT domain-containing protein